jgi:hypothetical protein
MAKSNRASTVRDFSEFSTRPVDKHYNRRRN